MPQDSSSPPSNSSDLPLKAVEDNTPTVETVHSTNFEEKRKGNQTPRLETSSTLTNDSRAEDIIALAEALGMPLLPWQQHVCNNALKVKENGRWQHRTNVVLVARQSGKTHLLRMRILAGLLLWDERLIIATAQSREVALETFRSVVDIAQNTPWIASEIKRVSVTNGKEELELKNGARYKIVAPTAGGPRGLTADLAIIDELREHASFDSWAAMTYTLQTTAGQIWTTSNAGDATSVVLNRLREQAMNAMSAPGSDDSMYYAEWSADPTTRLDDREGWYQANPSLGYLIDEDTIESRYKSDPPSVFRTEALCQWVDILDAPWTAEAWQACMNTDLTFDPSLTTMLAIDVTPDRRHAALVAVQLLEGEEHIGAHLLDTWDADDTIDDLAIAGQVAKAARTTSARIVAFDRYTAAGIASRLVSAGIPVGDCSGINFATACDELLGSINSKRIQHAGQEVLTKHVLSSARKWVSDGGWRIVRRQSAGPVAAAVALAMATHYAIQPLPKAELYIG
jgi:phage terminase large subunit-like protein